MGELQAPSAALVDEGPTVSTAAFLAIIRDIARGGLAGLIVGFIGAGLGSRLAMRMAALLVPQANGLLTENGFPIGRITLDGTIGLVLFGGLAATLFLAVTWVVIAPWLPRRLAPRALVAVPIAIAFGAGALIDARNPDFSVLRRDPLVVATLVMLIAALGPAMALADAWLDRILPRPTPGSSGAAMGYASLTAIGALLGVALVLQATFEPRGRPFGLTMLATGACTLVWWALRMRGRTRPGRTLRWAAGGILVAGTVAGLATVVQDIAGALGR